MVTCFVVLVIQTGSFAVSHNHCVNRLQLAAIEEIMFFFPEDQNLIIKFLLVITYYHAYQISSFMGAVRVAV